MKYIRICLLGASIAALAGCSSMNNDNSPQPYAPDVGTVQNPTQTSGATLPYDSTNNNAVPLAPEDK